MKKIFSLILLIISSFIYSQKEGNKCLDISILKPLEKKTEQEKKYINKYLDQLNGKTEIKTLLHPRNTLHFNKNCNFPNNYNKIRFSLEILKLKDNSRLIIETNADTYEYKENPEITLKRGEIIKDIFSFYGISTDRITIVDNKDEYPIDNNETKDGQKSNRRVELRIPNYL